MHQSHNISAEGFMLTPANAPDLAVFMPTARDLAELGADVFSLGLGLGLGRRDGQDEAVREGRWEGLLPWQVKRVRDYVDADLHGAVSVGAAAGLARLSPSYFSRRFRQSFGVTFSRFVAGRRIERAQDLMSDDDGKLCHIALACGFADQSHFTRTFTNLMGCSPARWRRRHVAPALARV